MAAIADDEAAGKAENFPADSKPSRFNDFENLGQEKVFPGIFLP